MKTFALNLLLLALSACATCREHPVACSAVAIVVLGSVAVAANRGGHASISTCPTNNTAVLCHGVAP